MPRTPNAHGGGAATNANGLLFEQTTSLDEILSLNGYEVNNDGEVRYNNNFIGYSKSKHKFKSFLGAKGVIFSVNTDTFLPDDAFINITNKTVYIIEKKFQNCAGSVDEKLQTCLYKKNQYSKLVSQIGYNIVYIYVLNDWFKQSKYGDVLQYIKDVGCYYFFNEIPLTFLNI